MKENDFPGVVLRERRESKGYSIEGARLRTHVSAHCLQAFESGVFKDMPEQAYAVGFLRSYCRFLEMDPEPFVDQYLICSQPEQVSGPFNFMKRAAGVEKTMRPHPRWLDDLITWGAVCVVILLGWLTYSTLVRPLAESWQSRVEAGGVEIEPPVHFQEDL